MDGEIGWRYWFLARYKSIQTQDQAHQVQNCCAAVDCDMGGWNSVVYSASQTILSNINHSPVKELIFGFLIGIPYHFGCDNLLQSLVFQNSESSVIY